MKKSVGFSKSGFLYVEPILILLTVIVFAFVALVAFKTMRQNALKSNIGRTLEVWRVAIKMERARAVLLCNAPLDEKLEAIQLNLNNVTLAGSCKGKPLDDEQKRFIMHIKFATNPFVDSGLVTDCHACKSPCDSACIEQATTQTAGWCFDSQTDRFWPASNLENECSL